MAEIMNLADTAAAAAPAAELPEPKPKTDPVSWLEDHGDALYAYALLRVNEPAVAEDLVQETLITALKSVDNFKGESTERTWLTGILKHKVLDQLRKKGREQPLGDDALLDDQSAGAWFDESGHWIHKPGYWQEPDRAMENSQFWETMKNCVDKLPEKLRLLYMLREFDGLETDEIIETLGISSRNNLWVMLSRARMNLRGCLELNWFGT
ncbi:MAG: sigma-70 family RNA polymerase sigma factor [Thiotrichales bacterium]|nr:sigma-70 family RNA polymerase sigma factor [Thiotrichales bacterium]